MAVEVQVGPPARSVRERGDTPHGLRHSLLAAGLTPLSPTVALGLTLPRSGPAPAIEVVEVAESPDYLDVIRAGYELDPARSRMLTVEHGTPGLRRYLAFVDGVPAGAAALFTHGRTSLLAGAATVPALRGRGCQQALIARRLADAAAGTAVVTTAFSSPSRDNLERLGFRPTHVRTVWC
jgi:hypothetical protein